jgi:meso-butanediol dehydrogenase/(S,S)-butanediol dehydrogenase/diacetyl reductase
MTAGARPVTLVTGAASGIGRATVELLLETGGAVVALDRDPDALGWLAGAPASKPIEELDLATFDACLEVNLRAVVLGLRAALPALRASRGAVVVTASVTALGGEPNRWPYAAAKAGAVNLVRSVPSTSPPTASGSTRSAPGRCRPG